MPTLPRRWGSVLTLRCLWLTLTAISIREGTELQSCGTVSCGFGAECFQNTDCVCLSDNGKRMQQSSTFYCLGKGVKQCGAQLCGYGAECNTDKSVCRCSSSNGALTKLNDTYPSLWYCLGEGVTQCGSQLCGNGTECNTTSGLCECSPRNRVLTQLTDTSPALSYCEALSSKSTTSVGSATTTTTTTADPKRNRNAQSDCNALTVGLAVGFGEALCIAVIVVVVVLIRKHWCLKVVELCKSQGSVLQNINSNDNLSAAETGHSYENVGSSSSLEESRRSRRTGPRVEIEMDINETDAQPIGDSPAYEDVSAPSQSPNDNDNSGLYESVNTRDTSGTRLYTSLVENIASQ